MTTNVGPAHSARPVSPRPIVAAALLASFVGCPDQKASVLSSGEIERRTRDPEEPFQRGPKRIGENCTRTIDCFSLNCVAGLCSQPCTGSACPAGSACYSFVLGRNCEADQECADLPECAGRGCTCDQGVCGVFPLCYEVCQRDAVQETTSCSSEQTVCRPNTSLNTSVCVPRTFIPFLGQGDRGVGQECPTGLECDGPNHGLECIGAPAGPGGPNYPNGYCTKECLLGDCPPGSVCALGFCHASCNPGDSCAAANAICLSANGVPVCALDPDLILDAGVSEDSGEPPDAGAPEDTGTPDSGSPGGGVGAECPTGSECTAGLICEIDVLYPNGYCTQDCNVNPACPPGSKAHDEFDGVTVVCRCRDLCTGPADCAASGSICLDDGLGDMLCF